MARAPDPRINQAKAMYLNGMKLVEIASQLKLPEGTVRRWKSTHNWDSERSDKKTNVRKEKTNRERDNAKADAVEIERIIENSDLTDKQQLFCALYIKCFNATKAYQKAYGCSYKTAMVNGPKLLGNIRVKETIKELKRDRLNRELLSEADIFQKYMDIAFADITDYMEFGTEQAPVMSIYGPVQVKNPVTGEKETLMKIVNVARFKESTEVDGTILSEVKQGKDGASIKLNDRMKALQWLSDHMDLATREQKARIEQIEANTERIRSDRNNDGEDGVVIVNDAPAGKNIGHSDTEVPADIQQPDG